MKSQTYIVTEAEAGATLAAVLRRCLPGQSWKAVRQLIALRHVLVHNEICLDPARRLPANEEVEVRSSSAPRQLDDQDIVIRYADRDLVVVEKPSGICTVRHPSEREWTEHRKRLSPTLEDLVPKILRRQENRTAAQSGGRMRIVQRLDKLTSGLLVFARTVTAESGLGKQFHRHTVLRKYLAIVVGVPKAGRIASNLARDRGDGRRGSTDVPGLGKPAVTHLEILARVKGYSLISCKLETGRTHQIRIHLAEQGSPVCGEPVYCQRLDGSTIADESQAPRMALHAAELGFIHPTTGETLSWEMPLPSDLQEFWTRLGGKSKERGSPVARQSSTREK